MKYLITRALYAPVCELELRFDADSNLLTGMFPYRSEADLRDGTKEMFLPGAFKRSVADTQTKFLMLEHDPAKILADTNLGKLKLDAENEIGLRFTASNVKLDNVESYGISVGFLPAENGQFFTKRGNEIINCHRDVNLFEISLTKNPAYKNTQLSREGPFKYLSNRWL